ncbi:hypothetical protein NDU88_000712 [Pleurodeles waltl]|uniref:Uncharacterized protein n=1 Tax=Pleurodeles waltl TaxID=8319 RepID=A0AAV7S8W5_PLEWA|nr:hypothetical protein NDU88_000712 [Pleurodeles waltl]
MKGRHEAATLAEGAWVVPFCSSDENKTLTFLPLTLLTLIRDCCCSLTRREKRGSKCHGKRWAVSPRVCGRVGLSHSSSIRDRLHTTAPEKYGTCICVITACAGPGEGGGWESRESRAGCTRLATLQRSGGEPRPPGAVGQILCRSQAYSTVCGKRTRPLLPEFVSRTRSPIWSSVVRIGGRNSSICLALPIPSSSSGLF